MFKDRRERPLRQLPTSATRRTRSQGRVKSIRRPLQPKPESPVRAIAWRLKQLGYDPIPLYGFRRPFKAWPRLPNDEASIAKWNATGVAVRLYGSELGVADIDVGIAEVRDAIVRMIEARWPAFGRECIRRHSGAVRVALIGRTFTCRKHMRSSRWRRAEDVDDGRGHMVEAFAGNDRRFVAVWGPHSVGRNYGYYGPSLLDTPLSALPEFPGGDIGPMLDECDRIFAAAGLVKIVDEHVCGAPKKLYDLEPDMRIVLGDGDEMTLAELEEIVGRERIECYPTPWDPKSTTPRVLANASAAGLALFDTKFACSHRWAHCAPVDRSEFEAAIQAMLAKYRAEAGS